MCSSKNLVEEKVAVQRLQLLETASKPSDTITVVRSSDLDKEGKIADNTDELQADLIESEEDQRQGYEVEPVVVKVQVDDKNIEQIVDLKNMKSN